MAAAIAIEENRGGALIFVARPRAAERIEAGL
jgi:hypothetical protein